MEYLKHNYARDEFNNGGLQIKIENTHNVRAHSLDLFQTNKEKVHKFD
jgi:hypothetical protein